MDTGVVQTNVISIMGAEGFSGLGRQPEFDGEISSNQTYVMVDDFISMC